MIGSCIETEELIPGYSRHFMPLCVVFNSSAAFRFRSKDLVEDFYLAPFACAEVGFLHLEEGDLDQAKEYLNKARYARAI